ncbi:SigE family RNA polymerase sigma factor [Actinospica durhamensis]|uniref:SigE family RNA polymerase sigma factor n=1 Tax=Actinospica durhamensis TaxID=1508375 RepID=A0A941EU08_9ACTN|nr:SigE family RNA polymerase sigma factor [Actinospica durhamensis]MBR7835059.1 SigE family RNA polymerase sigma factor [Actinospica durhamensis]
MSRSTREDETYTEYVTAKVPWLRRIAFLLCQDWHRADDLVQSSIAKLYVNWDRACRLQSLDGYVRAIVVNTFLAEQRSPWWKRVVLYREHEQVSVVADRSRTDSDAAIDLRRALALLPARQRAAIVLRYYCELSIEESAEALACSPGNIKSQTSRGLAGLRRMLGEEYVANRTSTLGAITEPAGRTPPEDGSSLSEISAHVRTEIIRR